MNSRVIKLACFTTAMIVIPHIAFAQSSPGSSSPLDRTRLPIAEPNASPVTELDVRNTRPPARFQVTAPQDAPNVVIILIDDLGFGATSAFGGPIPTPTLDRLAKSGLRYNNFHTTGSRPSNR